MENENYSFEDFLDTLKSEFTAYSGSETETGETYSQDFFDKFLKKLAGSDSDSETESSASGADQQTTGIRDLYITPQTDPVICSVFGYNVTKSEMLILNTVLNVAMFAIAAVTFVKIRRA